MPDFCSNSRAKLSSIDCIHGADAIVSISTKEKSRPTQDAVQEAALNVEPRWWSSGLEFLSQIPTDQRLALTFHSIGQRLAAIWVNMLYESQAGVVGSPQACALTQHPLSGP